MASSARKLPRFLAVTGQILRHQDRHLIRKAVRIWFQHGARGLWARAVQLYRFRGSIDEFYAQWTARYETPIESARERVGHDMRSWFSPPPLISILLPVHGAERVWLERAIGSVRSQTYPYWELCIADDASTAPHVHEVIARHAGEDQRIRTVLRESNGDISANCNGALGLATGDFVALLDQDDELPEHTLYWVAREIVTHPNADLIYSDEDKLDAKGARVSPYFKPDWNPALMLSQNMFSHLGVFRRSLVAQAGGFRAGFEGSQDHDLVLRCAELTTPERIRHIPRVLYHRRVVGSATTKEAELLNGDAGARAIKEHLAGRGITADVVQRDRRRLHAEYALPSPTPLVSIIVPSTCQAGVLEPCLQSLMTRTPYALFEILLLVNERHQQIPERNTLIARFAGDPRLRVLAYPDRPFNYSWVNNWGVRQAQGELLCFLNDDTTVITPDWLERLVARASLPGVAAAGPMLRYPDGSVQHAGVILGLGGVAGHACHGLPRGACGYFDRACLEQDVSCLTAACLVMRKDVFVTSGGFDEELPIAYNDVDLCVRLRAAGWRLIWTPTAELYHHESKSVGRHDAPERADEFAHAVALMRKRWGAVLDADPYYNPNLSLLNQFQLAFPPRIGSLADIAPASERG